jgi:hypothetical protein
MQAEGGGGGASTPASIISPPAPLVAADDELALDVTVALDPPDPVGCEGVDEHARPRNIPGREHAWTRRRAIDSRMADTISLVRSSLETALARPLQGLDLRPLPAEAPVPAPPPRC